VASRTDNDLDDMFVQAVRRTLRALIVVLGVLFISQTILQWNITALLASAGVAGLAIAFAAQDTIANFFGSFMLLLDRPFKVGERVVVNGSEGFVEGLAFRSTRVRTLDGHLVSIPNKIVANEKIENIGRRPFIRRVANITVTYDTPVAKLERGVSCIKEILARHGHMHPDMPPRVYFSDFNDWSLNILMVAWYKPERGPVEEWWEYLEWCEQVNFDIMRAFEAEGIEFAFPTNTTYLAHDPRRELTIATVPLPGSGGAE
jgi:MscS family membrane protein